MQGHSAWRTRLRLAARARGGQALRVAAWGAGWAVLLSVSACSTDQSRPSTDATAASPAMPGPAPAEGAAIRRVLAAWGEGQQDRAVDELRSSIRSGATTGDLRTFHITEQQFVELSQSEREALQKRMLETLGHLRSLARELQQRARQATADGHPGAAQELVEAMRRLAAANRGPQVCRLVDLFGQRIDKLADQALAEHDRAPAGGEDNRP